MLGIATLFLAVSLTFPLAGDDYEFDKAKDLYDRGLYVEAMNRFQALPQYGNDPVVDGYAVLCGLKLRTDGCVCLADNYLTRYRSSSLYCEICLEEGNVFFDAKDYEAALARYVELKVNDLPEKDQAAYVFDKGYCLYKTGDLQAASREFSRVDKMRENDYSAPSRYMSGYMAYKAERFDEAISLFTKASFDERFTAIANYYIINCHFEKKDYDYVLTQGVKLYEEKAFPADRAPHLARIISESYLVKGDKARSKAYFDLSDDGGRKSRSDLFFTGSLMYTLGKYREAIENFRQVTDVNDSLTQLAHYKTALANIELKNKVAALDAFKNAANLDFDRNLQEDAWFNYAKLAFDLNGDTSVFSEYMRLYSDKVRGEKIYSYMALAALSNKDWQAALDSYDKIEELSGKEKTNYVNASYLRGEELLRVGSWKRAGDCFQVSIYYTSKDDVVNQLSRYYLAEALYREGNFAEARKQYSSLFNSAALYGMEQGDELAYDIAYCYLKQEDYQSAASWFERCFRESKGSFRKDAMLRRADCFFALAQYGQAIAAYKEEMAAFPADKDLYSCYRCAIAYGLTKDQKNKLEVLKKVDSASPEDPMFGEAMLELGKTRMAQKQTKAAASTFSRLAELMPGTVYEGRALLELGTIKRNSGDADGALACYKSVVEKAAVSGIYVEDALLAIESIYKSQNQPQKYFAYLDSVGRGGGISARDRQTMVFASAQQLFFDEQYQTAIVAFEEFAKTYPQSGGKAQALSYVAESYKALNDKQKALETYELVLTSASGQLRDDALRNLAELEFSMENFDKAYDAFRRWKQETDVVESGLPATAGMMRSAYKVRNYQAAYDAAVSVSAESAASPSLKREAGLLQARSLLAMSRRDDALVQLSALAKEPKTAEGAEATYLIVKHHFDNAEFAELEKIVFAFGGSGTTQNYWLARSFILLGDSYMEQGKTKQAKATFESILNGYNGKDDIPDEIKMRLDKLEDTK